MKKFAEKPPSTTAQAGKGSARGEIIGRLSPAFRVLLEFMEREKTNQRAAPNVRQIAKEVKT